MTCSTYLARHSEYSDGLMDAAERRRFEQHAAECPACRRYSEVLRRGRELLLSLPEPRPAHDFSSRLTHRLYHEREARAACASAVPGTTVFAMAVIITVLAWSPTLWLRDTVTDDYLRSEMMPAVVPIDVVRPAVWSQDDESPGYLPVARSLEGGLERGLWDDAPALMYEYSTVSRRYRDGRPGALVASPDG